MIVPVRHSLHKLIQQVIIGLASHSLVSQPDVERVLEQRLQKHMEAEDRLAGKSREYETNWMFFLMFHLNISTRGIV